MQPNGARRLAVVDSPPKSSTKLTSQQKESHQKASIIVARAMIAAGGCGVVARKLDKSKQYVSSWTDPESARSLTVRDALAVGGTFLASLADQLAAVANEAPAPKVSPQSALAATARLTSDLASALADGKFSAEERREVAQEVRRLIPLLQGLMKGE